MKPRLRLPLFLAVFLSFGAPAFGTPESSPGNTSEQLHDLFAREWAHRLEENPVFATSVGVHDYDDRLASMSKEDLVRRATAWQAFLDELEELDVEQLSPADRVHAAVFGAQLRSRIEGWDVGIRYFPFNADSGFHSGLTHLPSIIPMSSEEDALNYIARLEAVSAWMDQHLELLREAISLGMTQPAVVLQGYEATIDSHLVEDPELSVFWAPFEELPAWLDEERRAELRERGRAAIMESVVPAYQRFLDLFRSQYLPAARPEIGATTLPGGRALYQQTIREYTTLDLTPEEIHEIGVSEVARIRAQMEQILEDVSWDGTFEEFLTHLRTDPSFYATSPRALLERASYIAKKMDGALPSLFGHLPRQPYGVEPVPAHIAPKYTAGRYVSSAPDSGRPGLYWVNTYDLPSRPLYALPALTLHEAVPGHHLQHALAAEAEDLPIFRRFDYISAFGEGWGLYSEFLGIEAGIYETPYENFGRLTYEMWRACRLVVDTGMHALGWSRQRAMDFMAANTALSLHEIETETDRYISWPGQALSYKLGEIKIRELRRRAEEALGPAFDVKTFHDALLRNGSVPLPVLEDEIDLWITEQGKQGMK